MAEMIHPHPHFGNSIYWTPVMTWQLLHSQFKEGFLLIWTAITMSHWSDLKNSISDHGSNLQHPILQTTQTTQVFNSTIDHPDNSNVFAWLAFLLNVLMLVLTTLFLKADIKGLRCKLLNTVTDPVWSNQDFHCEPALHKWKTQPSTNGSAKQINN